MTERTFLDGLLSEYASRARQAQIAERLSYWPYSVTPAEHIENARQRIINAVQDYGKRCAERGRGAFRLVPDPQSPNTMRYEPSTEDIAKALMAETESN